MVSPGMAVLPATRAKIGHLVVVARCCVAVLFVAGSLAGAHAADEPIRLTVIGGIAAVSQYAKFERPFWLRDIPRLTNGHITAELHPFDQSDLCGQEMLPLMRLGVVPFGTALLAMVSADEPELNAVDLPLLNPDMASLRKTVGLYRGHLLDILQRKYGIELLGIYAYPAQVLYCAKAFDGLNDLAGRKVRTSSVGQSELMTALGAIPVMTPFSEIVGAISNKVVDCAITGTMSGNQIGLPAVTSYIYPMAISGGLSFFGANAAAWQQLPPDLRDTLQINIHNLELAIWDSAERETAGGLPAISGRQTVSTARSSI
jgi:TRAP-type C4-dicarboxylate transport system substrate-binding protein